MTTRIQARLLAATSAILLLATSKVLAATLPTGYTLVDLTPLATGSNNVYAGELSDVTAGNVFAAGTALGSDFEFHATLWDASGAVLNSGAAKTRGLGVNTTGQNVGYFLNAGFDNNALSRTAGGTATTPLPLPSGDDDGNNYAYGVNANGAIVGSYLDAISGQRPVVWSSSAATGVALPSTSGNPSAATRINNAGFIVGYDNQAPAVWKPDGFGGYTETLLPGGMSFGYAWGINNAANPTIVGYNADNHHAASWTTADGGATWTYNDLGQVNSSLTNFDPAFAINDAGIVVGIETDGSKIYPTVLGTGAAAGPLPGFSGIPWALDSLGFHDINSLLSLSVGSNWSIKQARSINNQNWILATAIDSNDGSGRGHTVILVPPAVPEPSSVVLLSLGVLGVIAWRRSRR